MIYCYLSVLRFYQSCRQWCLYWAKLIPVSIYFSNRIGMIFGQEASQSIDAIMQCNFTTSFLHFADEREAVQKKTFTKWVNSHLGRVTSRIGDLYTDLRDGRMLIRLLEVLSGEQLVSITQKLPFSVPNLTQAAAWLSHDLLLPLF